MRTTSILCAALLAAGAAAQTNVVKVGDRYEDVLRALGPPAGRVQAGTYQQLTYERGRVELRDGRVIGTDLVSPEEASRRKVAREKETANASARAEQLRTARVAEGQAVLQQSRVDAGLAAASPTDQVGYWKTFQERYPEVDASADLQAAQQRLQAQQRVVDTIASLQQRVQELEQQLAAAEERAAKAEADLNSLRNSAYVVPGGGMRTPRTTP
jgi:hypothetical protein